MPEKKKKKKKVCYLPKKSKTFLGKK